jgi:hypothetical protein
MAGHLPLARRAGRFLSTMTGALRFRVNGGESQRIMILNHGLRATARIGVIAAVEMRKIVARGY